MTAIPPEIEILVTEQLETSGVLNNLRTQLQTHIQLLVAQYAADANANASTARRSALKDTSPVSSINDHKQALEVIVNFLQFFGLKNSVAVLLAELKSVAHVSVVESLQSLASKSADETSKSISTSLDLSTSRSQLPQPVLTHLITKCTRMNTDAPRRISLSDSLDDSFGSTISSIDANYGSDKSMTPIQSGLKMNSPDFALTSVIEKSTEEKQHSYQPQSKLPTTNPIPKALPELPPLPKILSKPPLPPVVTLTPVTVKKDAEIESKPSAAFGRRSLNKSVEESKENDAHISSLSASNLTQKFNEEMLLSDMDEIIEECVEYSDDDFEEEHGLSSQFKYEDPIVPKGFEKRFDHIEDVKF